MLNYTAVFTYILIMRAKTAAKQEKINTKWHTECATSQKPPLRESKKRKEKKARHNPQQRSSRRLNYDSDISLAIKNSCLPMTLGCCESPRDAAGRRSHRSRRPGAISARKEEASIAYWYLAIGGKNSIGLYLIFWMFRIKGGVDYKKKGLRFLISECLE